MVIIRIIVALAFTIISSFLFAQLPQLPANMSNVRSSDISIEQLSQIVTYMRQNNITEQQVYDNIVARGMQSIEASTLRSRLRNALQNPDPADKSSKTNPNQQNNNNVKRYTDTSQNTMVVENPLKIFGLEIFNNGVLTFEPNLKIATPVGYIIGPDDEIVISIYGYQEANYNLTVGPEGNITIPYVGVLYVAGLTLEQAAGKIRNRLASAGYANIRSGLTKVSVSVGRIRSIGVTVLGEVKNPGRFTLSSLSTAFNALYQSRGPNEIGSMRKIEVIRNGKVISHLDMYDFLVNANRTGDINLHDQDIIRVPPYDVRVAITGEVKRTGLFEIVPGETFQDLLRFAGGFGDSAYTASVTAYKSTDIEKRIIDIDKSEYATYKPGRSESYVVKKLVERFVNRVSVSGAVYLPGYYELTPGMTLQTLLVKAQGLRENAYTQRGLIFRRSKDLTQEYVSFNPLEVMNNNGNISLQRDDSVVLSTLSAMRDSITLSITGEVRHTGTYPYAENMSLKDLVLLAGGFTDAAIPQRIEVARRIKADTFSIADVQIAQVLNVTSLTDLQVKGADIHLQPYDAIIVRRNPGFQEQVNVRVEGEVVFPGPYVLQTKNERVSSVIKRAGGLTLQAYANGGYISRINKTSVINQVNTEKITRIQQELKDTASVAEEDVAKPVDQIAVNLKSILAFPGGKEDIVMEEGDVLTIQKEKMEVRISGEVLFPTRVVYQDRFDLKDYISRAGGFTDNSRKARVYVLHPNGNASRTKHFLFFRSYPYVTPGSEVIVPKKPQVERRRLSTGEIVGITTAITALAGVLIQLLR